MDEYNIDTYKFSLNGSHETLGVCCDMQVSDRHFIFILTSDSLHTLLYIRLCLDLMFVLSCHVFALLHDRLKFGFFLRIILHECR